ncbi:MAG: RHS repeat-associated core domain-containing protein, partial [Candidatus Thiodiazotropha sp. (ex Lucinoma borealis)]|nr:RHS repeat-associated core domain-containing protein [Candidatus Thiodiazotropha sp. (ex Lucinoma borealis)]
KSRLKWQADYDPFGRATVKTQRIGFNLRRPGQYEDAESGLYDNYLRRYDPGNGRYLEPDPLGNLDGMNRYAYVGNRPLERTDPLGLFGVRAGVTSIDVPIAPLPGGGWQYGSVIDFGLGSAVHETIVLQAFERFNESHPGAFSDHTIDLFIAANVRTDLIFDANHQFSGANHFDNPNDTPWNQTSGPSTWILDSFNSIQNRRGTYAGDSIEQPICRLDGQPTYDISSVVEGFGSVTHTLADFYAHTNWVDPTNRGGSYYIEREATNFGMFRESGYVPPGLNMSEIFNFDTMSDAELNDWMTRLYSGNAEGCADMDCAFTNIGLGMIGIDNWNGDLNLQPEDSYYHNVKGGQDNEGRWDETTHAYWQKDSREDAEDIHSFIRATQLAVAHTVEEIERLWAATEGNDRLRDIFTATEQGKIENNVYYAERPLNGTAPDCPLCPVFGTWRDHRVDITNP